MAGIIYTGANGNTVSFDSPSANDALTRLGRIKGYLNPQADSMTAALANGLAKKSIFTTNGGRANTFNPKSAKKGIGTSISISGFAGLIVEDGVVVGARVFTINVQDGLIVGTSGVREERYSVDKVKETKIEQKPVNISASGYVVVGTEYDPKTHILKNILGELKAEGTNIYIAKSNNEQTVTQAVEETVIS